MNADTLELIPIGFVRSDLTSREDAPKQGFEGGVEAVVEIEQAFERALDGVSQGQELILLTWFHQSDRETLMVHPRGDISNPLAGVFVTRSPARPNPIGLHRGRVIRIDGRKLTVHPLEAIDGTPLLDIKPLLEESADF